jgi:tyrosine-protein phosphatase SIW14
MTKKSSLAPRFFHAGVASIVLLLAITSLAVPPRVKESKEAFAGVSIKNFGKVNDNYYRGAQPLNQEEFDQLKKLGIKTVIDLRKDNLRPAADWAKTAGLQYFNIPLLAYHPTTVEQTDYFLKLVNDPANQPVYVHCKSGKHRTGGMTAIYRISHDGWTVDQAYKEMEDYDFNGGIFGGPGTQKKFLYDFYDRYSARSSQTQR